MACKSIKSELLEDIYDRISKCKFETSVDRISFIFYNIYIYI